MQARSLARSTNDPACSTRDPKGRRGLLMWLEISGHYVRCKSSLLSVNPFWNRSTHIVFWFHWALTGIWLFLKTSGAKFGCFWHLLMQRMKVMACRQREVHFYCCWFQDKDCPQFAFFDQINSANVEMKLTVQWCVGSLWQWELFEHAMFISSSRRRIIKHCIWMADWILCPLCFKSCPSNIKLRFRY